MSALVPAAPAPLVTLFDSSPTYQMACRQLDTVAKVINLDPGIAQRLIGFFSNIRPTTPSQIFPELTEREVEILALIAQGRTNEEIAEQFVLSLKTVRNHVSNIFSKLQVADRAQAVLRAREAGMG